MKIHTEAVTTPQLRLLKKIGPFLSSYGFYLGGGTAIALMLGHRKSVDLDWFSEKPTGDPNSWAEKIQGADIGLKDIALERGTLHATAGSVRISLLGYHYPRLKPLVVEKQVGFALASLDDLACMKLSAIASRGSKKDFIDIYALTKKHRTMKQILKLYEKRYRDTDLFPVLKGLSYFDDAEKERAPRMLWNVRWEDVKEHIIKSLKKSIV